MPGRRGYIYPARVYLSGAGIFIRRGYIYPARVYLYGRPSREGLAVGAVADRKRRGIDLRLEGDLVIIEPGHSRDKRRMKIRRTLPLRRADHNERFVGDRSHPHQDP
jgi:hypothetical protein